MKKPYIVIILLIIASLFVIAGLILSFCKSSTEAEHAMTERITAPDGPGSIPADWMDRQRIYPYGSIKEASFLTAMRQARDMHIQASSRSTVNWEFAGPFNIGGRITDIEMPAGSYSTIYIGAASGGLFKTTNNGEDWENVFINSATLPIGDIAVDPNNPEIVWAGTGEANASSQSVRGDGIYKSTDGGSTWHNAGLEQSAYFGRIIVDYSNSNKVFAAVCGNLYTPDENRGIYRTEDGGNTWQKVLYLNDSVSGIEIVQHPTNPDILYAGMWERMRGLNYRRSFGPGSGIWKSIDGGDNWIQLGGGLPTGDNVGRIGLAISPSSPEILYAFIDMSYEVAIYKTTNNGENWSRLNDGALQDMSSNFGWYFGQIRVNPQNPNIVYVLGVDLFYTINGGQSWTQLAGYFNNDLIHVDHHALHIHPETGRILEGNDGGLYFSDDQGYNWTKINNLPLTQFYDISFDYLNPERVYGGTQDNNTIRTMSGQTDDWEAILGGDGFYSLVDYTNSNTIYAEYQYGALHKSTNGGYWMTPINGSWSNDRVNWSAPVIMHPEIPSTLYFGSYRVWRSTSSGNSWTAVTGDITDGDDGSAYHTITTLAISSVNPAIVLAGTDDGNVHITTNGGSSWNNISAGLPDRWITRVETDPFDENTIYVTISGFRWDQTLPHIFKSENLGQTWTSISGNLPELPVNAFIADPTTEGRLFAGTDGGMFYTKDGGTSWESLNGTLGNIIITSMKIHPDANYLLIGTYGLGAYKLDLDELIIRTKDINHPLATLRIISAYPQPFNCTADNNLMFKITAESSVRATIRILESNGKMIFEENGINLNQGNNTYTLRSNFLKPGIYFIEVKTDKDHCTSKFIAI
ncbi:MAG TPA: T9SS type A sorting domain-containing protein [Lentimicrobium sp.]|nr:T9SS type A sorting domain-containing protein [Lentimicrobium sp.]